MALRELASYRKLQERVGSAWPSFLAAREESLAQQRRFGVAAEKVTENVVTALLTGPLDWPHSGVNYQVEYADLVITDLGIRRLIVETKRPDALAWNRVAVHQALAQARRYAEAQGVARIAVSDGRMLYAADVAAGGFRDRLLVDLASPVGPEDLWWLSRHGLYRERTDGGGALDLLPTAPAHTAMRVDGGEPGAALHPTYKLPVHCFAFVGRADDPRSWKLPYLLADGQVDRRRLPKAIQAILTNYRGAKVGGIPESAIGAVLTRLAQAASAEGLLPPRATNPAPVYRQLAETLEQLQRQA